MEERTPPVPSLIRFGNYEADLRSRELRRDGVRLKLEGQPFQILALLLAHPGELVTRDELRQQLWPANTFVDFEHSINTAVKRLREVLGDSAETPRFVETLPRRGYRFIYPVDRTEARVVAPSSRWRRRWVAYLVLITLPSLLVGSLALNVFGLRDRVLGSRVDTPISSLAVLPLENLSGDSSQEYLVDGIHDELITRLGQIRSLRVIGRTSVLRYKVEKRKPLREIERDLGVGAVLEGSVRRMGDRVRLTARLILVPTERQLWTGSYEAELRDIVTLQNDVVRAIATELKITLTPPQQAQLLRARPVNPEAQEAYLIGRYSLREPPRVGARKALQYFGQAIEKDPNYAPPYTGVAITYLRHGGPNLRSSRKESLVRAKAAAEKAIELDDTLAEAHEAHGWTRMLYDRDWPGAEKAFRQVRELNSSFPGSGYANWLIAMSRIDDAIAEMERVRKLEPLDVHTTNELARMYFVGRQYDRAIQLFQASLNRDPTRYVTHLWLGWAYLQKGMHADAIAVIEKQHLAPELLMSHYVANAYAVAGKKEQARKILSEVIELSKQQFVHAVVIARTYVALGEKDQVFAWLDRAYEQYEFNVIHLNDPQWDPVRADPRFRALLKRMNLPH